MGEKENNDNKEEKVEKVKEQKEVKEIKQEDNIDYKKGFYKKWLILIIGIIIVIVAGVMVFSFSNRNNKEAKAKEVFGDEYCDSVLHMATRDLVKHTCAICGAEFEDSSMRADICDKCAKELDRCNFCGKKLSEDIKEQRNELLGE